MTKYEKIQKSYNTLSAIDSIYSAKDINVTKLRYYVRRLKNQLSNLLMDAIIEIENQNLMQKELKKIVTVEALEALLLLICNYLKLDVEICKSKTRKQQYVFARYVYFYIAREKYSELIISLQEIGDVVYKDHATVIFGKNQVLEQPDFYMPSINAIKEKLI